MSEKVCKSCGNQFLQNRPNQIYCSRKCGDEFYSRKLRKQRQAAKTNCDSEPKPDKNRPFTAFELLHVHKWSQEGMTAKDIASMINRSVENVTQGLETPLPDSLQRILEEYLIPERGKK